MEEHYAFRRNMLSGKTEIAVLKDEDDASPENEKSRRNRQTLWGEVLAH